MSVTVLHVAQPVDGGVPRVVIDLARDQLQRGWRVVLACPADGWLGSAARREGIDVLRWEATRSPGLSTITEVRRLGRVIARADPALVHLHSSKAGLAGRLAVRGALPTVFQPHAWSFDAVSGVVAAATRTWERRAVRWTDLIVAVSSDEQVRGERAGVRGSYVVAANGVDVERLHPSGVSEARDRLGLGAGPLAVCVGRLARQKGQDILVAGWPGVRDVVPDARLILVGDGPDRTHLETIRGEGVELVGGVDDPSAWYAAADVVVMPSRWEGMALVPLEAMACGRSVVSFAVAGVRESLGVDDSGSSPAGAVVPEGRPEVLLAAVAARLADPAAAAREGLAGRARVTTLFDVRRTAHDLTDRLAPLLRGARSG